MGSRRLWCLSFSPLYGLVDRSTTCGERYADWVKRRHRRGPRRQMEPEAMLLTLPHRQPFGRADRVSQSGPRTDSSVVDGCPTWPRPSGRSSPSRCAEPSPPRVLDGPIAWGPVVHLPGVGTAGSAELGVRSSLTTRDRSRHLRDLVAGTP